MRPPLGCAPGAPALPSPLGRCARPREGARFAPSRRCWRPPPGSLPRGSHIALASPDRSSSCQPARPDSRGTATSGRPPAAEGAPPSIRLRAAGPCEPCRCSSATPWGSPAAVRPRPRRPPMTPLDVAAARPSRRAMPPNHPHLRRVGGARRPPRSEPVEAIRAALLIDTTTTSPVVAVSPHSFHVDGTTHVRRADPESSPPAASVAEALRPEKRARRSGVGCSSSVSASSRAGFLSSTRRAARGWCRRACDGHLHRTMRTKERTFVDASVPIAAPRGEDRTRARRDGRPITWGVGAAVETAAPEPRNASTWTKGWPRHCRATAGSRVRVLV